MRSLEVIAAEAAESSARKLGRAFVDGGDDPEVAEPAGDLALPAAVFIRYGAVAGESQRAVTLLKIWRAEDGLFFRGQCHLRRGLRTFRADRVLELICLATGEVPDDVGAWLSAHGLFLAQAVDPTAVALRTCRDELAVLAYLARADGSLDPDEVEVAIDLVMMSTEDEIDRERVAVYVQRLAAGAGDLEDSLRRLAKEPPRVVKLNRAIRRLVDADGEMAIGEQLAVIEIAEFLQARLG